MGQGKREGGEGEGGGGGSGAHSSTHPCRWVGPGVRGGEGKVDSCRKGHEVRRGRSKTIAGGQWGDRPLFAALHQLPTLHRPAPPTRLRFCG